MVANFTNLIYFFAELSKLNKRLTEFKTKYEQPELIIVLALFSAVVSMYFMKQMMASDKKQTQNELRQQFPQDAALTEAENNSASSLTP